MLEWKSPKVFIIILAMILFSGIVGLSIVRDRLVNQQFKTVTVNGQGKVLYVPDLAIVTLGVQIDKVAKPEEALGQLNGKVTGIVKVLKDLGIPESDIQTQNYSLLPQYDINKDGVSAVSGYNANQQLVVKIVDYDKDPGKLGSVIASASKAGANQINSLNFDSSKINDLKQQARVLAISDAKNKSNALASSAGVELKEITGWYENLISPVPYYGAYNQGGMGGGQMSIPGVPISNREVVIEIGVTYNIK